MKMKFLTLFALFGAFLNAAENNLLNNADFTGLNRRNLPENWSIAAAKTEIAVENGSRILKVKTRLYGKVHKISLVQKLPRMAGGEYVFSGQIKGGISTFYLALVFSSGQKVKVIAARMAKAGEGWRKFSFPFSVTEQESPVSLVLEPSAPQADEEFQFKSLQLIRLAAVPAEAKTGKKPAPKKAVPAAAPLGKISADLVARPAAASRVTWPKHPVSGRDWWLMLHPSWRGMKELSGEAFIREAGWNGVGMPFVRGPAPRVTGITEIEIFQNGKNIAGKAEISFSSVEKATRFIRMDKIVDGDKKTAGWLMGDTKDFRKANRGLPFTVTITLPDEKPVDKIVLHMLRDTQPIINFSAFIADRELEVCIRRRKQDITLSFPENPSFRQIRLEGLTRQVVYRVGDLSKEMLNQIGSKPFSSHNFRFRHSAGLEMDNVDRASIRNFRAKYPNYITDTVGEVSANFYQKRKNPARFRSQLTQQAYIVPVFDRNKREYEATLRKYWNSYTDLFGNLNMLEGGLPTMPYYYEWGVQLCSLEAMNEAPAAPNRILMLFGRSGARQYNRPWGFYQTVYGEGTYANSRWSESEALKLAEKRPWHPGEDFGCSPSYTKRILYYAYYAGTNLQQFEAEPWGYAKYEKDGSWQLTGHGKSIRDIYEWTVRPEGKRGEFYAPVLLLTDYYSANWEWKRQPVWCTWYMFPYEDCDYMQQHIIRTIDPLGASFKKMKELSPGMRNSKFGDIYDCFFANAPSGAITVAELGKYPVAMVVGSIESTPQLSENLQQYVRAGGTLVINAAQMKLLPEGFAGVKITGRETLSNHMKILEVIPEKAEVLLKDSSGLPLVTRCRNGRGSIVLTTPYFLLNVHDRKACLPIIPALLEKIQSEVLPVKVEGDIQFCFNKMDGNDWKLILINNKGTFKPTMRTKEVFFPEYAKTVTITLPEGADAKEVRLNLPVTRNGNRVSVSVPPGDIAVVDLKNVNFSDSPIDSSSISRRPSAASVDSRRNNPPVVLDSPLGEGGKLTDVVREGNALRFNGKTSFAAYTVDIDRAPMPEGGFSCFAKPDPECKKGKCVVITDDFVRISIINGRWHLFMFDLNNIQEFTGPEMIPDKWTHVAFIWKNNEAHFYVDGKEYGPLNGLIFTGKVDSTAPGIDQDSTRAATVRLFLGSHHFTRKDNFKGLIRNIRFYGIAPSAAEIQKQAKP